MFQGIPRKSSVSTYFLFLGVKMGKLPIGFSFLWNSNKEIFFSSLEHAMAGKENLISEPSDMDGMMELGPKSKQIIRMLLRGASRDEIREFFDESVAFIFSSLEERVRAYIESGLYDSDLGKEIFENRVVPRLVRDVVREFDSVPVGSGHGYKKAAKELFSAALPGVVDSRATSVEIPTQGGRADISLPLKTERLDTFWVDWRTRYDVSSIFVETKNWNCEVGPAAVSQLLGDLEAGLRGRLGFLVSRTGFSENAMFRLSGIASRHKYLIIPFNHTEAINFCEIGCRSPFETEGFLRQKREQLIRHAC